MAAIQTIHAREVLDSRGKPTVEVDVFVSERIWGRAIVPAGASTGSTEAQELRDGEPQRYGGQGVRRAVEHVREILAPAILGCDPADQLRIDRIIRELDGTPNKGRLGANALLGVSLAVAHAAASVKGCPLYQHFRELLSAVETTDLPAPPHRGPLVPNCQLFLAGFRRDQPCMPLPMTNMISGGLHAGGNLDIQDVLIMPHGAPDYPTGLEWIVRVYRQLGKRLTQAGYEGWLVGDEGGFGPRLRSNREALEMVVHSIESAGLQPGVDMSIALDVAATHFYREGRYHWVSEGGGESTNLELIDRLERWVDEFPIVSIEDGLAEHDDTGWESLTRRLGRRVQLVGDDFFTTNAARVRHGQERGLANSVLIKFNQIGTLSEALETIVTARRGGYSLVVSARSGETEDTTMSDLAVGVSAEQIKIGSIVRSERLAKYNQLLRIAENLCPHG